MSDITKCSGKNCPLSKNCYRYTSVANDLWQSYFTEVPFNKETNDCEYFWNKTK